MCTISAFIKRDGSVGLAEQLEVDPQALRYGNDLGPGSTLSIVVVRVLRVNWDSRCAGQRKTPCWFFWSIWLFRLWRSS